MQVKDIMTRSVEVIDPDCTIEEAAQKMRKLNIGPLPVSSGGRLMGMLTDRDIAVRSTAQGEDPTMERVRDVMTPEVIHCFEDESVADAARIMKEYQVRRLVVLDRDKFLVGIVSLGDLAVDAHDEELVGSTLEGVSEPAAPQR